MVTTPAMIAFFGAAFIAMSSAVFGVGLARLFWAEELRRAQELRVIWDKTESALRSQIKSKDEQIEIRDRAQRETLSRLTERNFNTYICPPSPQPDPEAR